MSRCGASRVAHRTRGRGPRHTLRPCDLYSAAPSPRRSRTLPRTQNISARRLGLRGAAYLGPTTASSPSALCPPRGRPGARRDPVDPVSPPLLLTRPRPLAPFPAPLPRGSGADLCAGPALLDGALSGPRCACALAPVPRRLARQRMGRLRERAPPGAPARPPLLGPLYPPCGHLQSPSRRPGGWPGDLPLQGLPTWPPPAYPDARGR